MARGVTYLVFLLPIVFSFVFGGAVLGQVLQEPDRELNMWQIQFSGGPIVSSKSIQIMGLENQYSVTEPIEIEISVTDSSFDCGNLYVTIYHESSKEVITQSGFFDQCFDKTDSLLPLDEEFSEIIDEPGNYEIKVDLSDTSQKDSISTKGKFTVK